MEKKHISKVFERRTCNTCVLVLEQQLIPTILSVLFTCAALFPQGAQSMQNGIFHSYFHHNPDKLSILPSSKMPLLSTRMQQW